MMTGIWGQGIQLAAQVLARAAVSEGHEVLLFGSYGGMMRGGNTEATVVVADGPIESPPTIVTTWSAIVMHHEHSEGARRRLRPGSLVLLNTTVFEADVDWSSYRLVEAPATDLAVDVGSIQTATMAMIGAYCASTGLVELPALRVLLWGSPCPRTGPSTWRGTWRPSRPVTRPCPASSCRRGRRRSVVPVERRQRAQSRHPGDRRRGLQGMRAVHRRVDRASSR